MPTLPIDIPKVEYMTLHVTLIATKSPIRPAIFNLNRTVPGEILTTLPHNIFDAPFFHSIGRTMILSTGESVWKIFSPGNITDSILSELFGNDATIAWIHRKIWNAYPRLDPVSEFAPIELYPEDSSAGVWYTSGIETFISTMETSALAGRNIAHLIGQRLWGDTNEQTR
jgi:prenylcysteine oxidase / farnesylcysteine lyase